MTIHSAVNANKARLYAAILVGSTWYERECKCLIKKKFSQGAKYFVVICFYYQNVNVKECVFFSLINQYYNTLLISMSWLLCTLL